MGKPVIPIHSKMWAGINLKGEIEEMVGMMKVWKEMRVAMQKNTDFKFKRCG